MHLRVVLEAVFQRTADGVVVTGTPLHYDFFARYLAVFSTVTVVARVESTIAPLGWRAVEGDRIAIHPIPFYRGVAGYLRERTRVLHAMRAAVAGDGALIFRVPSPLGGCVDRELVAAGIPYAVEVVGDPWDVFAPGTIRHPLRPFLRWHFRNQLRRQCRHAIAGCYVTAEALQRRYPLRTGALSIAASDVDLGEHAFVTTPRQWTAAPSRPRLIQVGTLAQLYKAPDILIAAVAQCAQQGCVIDLELVGDGACRNELTSLAANLGISGQVHFAGQLPSGIAVRERLDQADVFVLPSRQEGLPRALVEAMARGLPCLGSTAGGIPELLEADEMVPPGNVESLSKLLLAHVRDPSWLNAASSRNLAKAAEYRRSVVDERHREFLSSVLKLTSTSRR